MVFINQRVSQHSPHVSDFLSSSARSEVGALGTVAGLLSSPPTGLAENLGTVASGKRLHIAIEHAWFLVDLPVSTGDFR